MSDDHFDCNVINSCPFISKAKRREKIADVSVVSLFLLCMISTVITIFVVVRYGVM